MSPALRNDSSAFFIPILIISAVAVPWIGAFVAIRSAIALINGIGDLIPGKYRLRPNKVSVYPCCLAKFLILSK